MPSALSIIGWSHFLRLPIRSRTSSQCREAAWTAPSLICSRSGWMRETTAIPTARTGTTVIFGVLGLNLALFIVEARSELKPASIRRFLATVHGQGIDAHNLTHVVSILAGAATAKDPSRRTGRQGTRAYRRRGRRYFSGITTRRTRAGDATGKP